MFIKVCIADASTDPAASFCALLTRVFHCLVSAGLSGSSDLSCWKDRPNLVMPCTDALKNKYILFNDGPISPDLLKFIVMFLDSCAALCLVTPAFLASMYEDSLMLFSKDSFIAAMYSKNCLGLLNAYSAPFLAVLFVSLWRLMFSITLLMLSEYEKPVLPPAFSHSRRYSLISGFISLPNALSLSSAFRLVKDPFITSAVNFLESIPYPCIIPPSRSTSARVLYSAPCISLK